MAKIISEDINFETGLSEDTLDSKLSFISDKLKTFTNSYVGNKRKIIYDIIKIIDKHNIPYQYFLDLFSGSGYMSMAMKMFGKNVLANDILMSSLINSISFVVNRDIFLSDEEKGFLLNNKPNKKDDFWLFIFEKYKDRFTKKELIFISNYYENATQMFGFLDNYDGFCVNTKIIKYCLSITYIQNYIIDNCHLGGRLNNGQILAKLDHRLSHKRNKVKVINAKEMNFNGMKWIQPLCPENKNFHMCLNLDAISFLEMLNYNISHNNNDKGLPLYDLCYIDPPYGGDQSNYGYMYGFFEECLRRKSYEDIEKSISALNNFVDKKNYKQYFERIIDLTQFIPWIVISYNNSSWAKIDKIIDITKKYRKNVFVEEINYRYKYRSKSNKEISKEYVILAN